MTEEPRKNQPKAMWTDDRHAPVVFFDAVPAVGVYAGIVGVTLSVDLARTIEPSEVTVTHTVIAYLRTSVQGAMLLRDNLDKAILMAMPKPETSN